MKYIEEFRAENLARQLALAIATEAKPQRQYRLMEFCGGHTHAIFRYGVQDLMPPNVSFIHGPGCPVCVLPAARLSQAIALAQQPNAILCSYADVLRVPAQGGQSLLKAKAEGADIRMVHSTLDALKIAQQHPQHAVIFFAIGFETTTPATAFAIRQAQALGLANFSVFCNHVLTPPAMQAILDESQTTLIDGFLGPSHVSTIIGSQAYDGFVAHYQKPLVIAGFEPLDVMQSSLMLIRQLNEGRCEVENEYTRAVTPEGNRKAQSLVADVFETRSTFEWRGLGWLSNSALQIKPQYAAFDAEQRYPLPDFPASNEVKACECPAILRGLKRPLDCKLFGTVCRPDNPMGACMVSSEGACAAYWAYARRGLMRENHTASP